MNYLNKKQSNILILLCFMVYTSGYLGRLSYNAGMLEILNVFGVSKAEGGLISSFFFFAYGAGQLINGMLCKKYNPRIVLTLSLIISAGMNLLLPFCGGVDNMKFVWLINGVAQSVLWTTIIRTLSVFLPNESLPKATLIMSATVAAGTFGAYGLAALMIALRLWKWAFFITAALLVIAAVVWFIGFGAVKKKSGITAPSSGQQLNEVTASGSALEEAPKAVETAPAPPLTAANPVPARKPKIKAAMVIFVIAVGTSAVVNGFIRDGVTTWTPVILFEEFSLNKSLSIILTLFLPLLALFGAFIASRVRRKAGNFNLLLNIFYIISGLSAALLILFLWLNALVPSMLMLISVSAAMAAATNILTAMIPFHYRKSANSGMVTGVINSFCYIGSTLSSVLLGLIADGGGWNNVFIVMSCVALAAVLVNFISLAANKKS